MKVKYLGTLKNRLPIVNIIYPDFNYIEKYFDIRKQELIQLIESNKLENEVFIVEHKASLHTHNNTVNNASFKPDKHIYLNEGYLEFLWEFTYGIVITWYELIRKPTEKKIIPTDDYFKSNPVPLQLLHTANEHLKLALSYFDTEIVINNNFANPTCSRIDFETEYVNLANSVFCFALCYTLFHEIAHCKFNHLDIMNSNRNKSQKQRDLLQKKLEEEADKYARESVILDGTDINFTKAIGAIIGASATIYYQNITHRDDHPNSAKRMEEVIKRFSEPNSELYGIGLIVLGFWDEKFGIDCMSFIDKNKTYEDSFYEYLNQYAAISS